jgi:acetyl-CoA C-acetyltransferase
MGALQGELKDFMAPELGAVAIRAAVERAGLQSADIQEVIMGCVLRPGRARRRRGRRASGPGCRCQPGARQSTRCAAPE